MQMQAAAKEITRNGGIPLAAFCVKHNLSRRRNISTNRKVNPSLK